MVCGGWREQDKEDVACQALPLWGYTSNGQILCPGGVMFLCSQLYL